MDKLNINSIPEPFKEFLCKEHGAYTKEGSSHEGREIHAMGAVENKAADRNKEMQDLLFLAAILMLCDD